MKLNHANLITNEKRSLIESETDICLTRASLFVLIVMSQNARYGDDGDSYWGNPFVLISKTSCPSYQLQSFSLSFVFWGYCFEESSKENPPSIFSGKTAMMLEQFSLQC